MKYITIPDGTTPYDTVRHHKILVKIILLSGQNLVEYFSIPSGLYRKTKNFVLYFSTLPYYTVLKDHLRVA